MKEAWYQKQSETRATSSVGLHDNKKSVFFHIAAGNPLFLSSIQKNIPKKTYFVSFFIKNKRKWKPN
jgi:hypothetical protein